MLSERVPWLLSDLVQHDGLDVSAPHSLAGFNLADDSITGPPSDAHHSAPVASIVGGCQRMARPGAEPPLGTSRVRGRRFECPAFFITTTPHWRSGTMMRFACEPKSLQSWEIFVTPWSWLTSQPVA
jgi:hypothetical protein